MPAHLAHGDYLGECIGGISFPGNLTGHELQEALEVEPNPSTRDFVITIAPEILQSSIIQIVDAMGKMIKEISQPASQSMDFSIDGNGIYIIRLISDQGIFTKKLIIAK